MDKNSGMYRQQEVSQPLLILLAILVALAGFAFGCASGKNASIAPDDDSIEALRGRYPERNFIMRSGRGDTPSEAAESARFEIVKYFEANISGETVIRQWAKEGTTGGIISDERFTELSKTMKLSAGREIPGIDIVKSGTIGSASAYEAWAVLDKAKYSGVLRGKITAIDSDVEYQISAGGDSDLLKLRHLSQALRALVLREQHRRDLLLIDVRDDIESQDGLARQITSEIDTIIERKFIVWIQFKNDIDDRVRAIFTESISGAGIRIMDYSGTIQDTPDLSIGFTFDVSERTSTIAIAGKDETLHWAEWTLSITAEEPATSRIVDSLVINGKSSGRDSNQAMSRMVTGIEGATSREITTWAYEVIFAPEE